MESLFVTGGSGFVGRNFFNYLDFSRYREVFSLSRNKNVPLLQKPAPHNLCAIAADLANPDGYRSFLKGCRTVIHLAAATGKAKPAEYHRVNAEGTEILLGECEKAGVINFLFISSIAVKFPQKKYYHYALAKEQAEAKVRQSRLHYTILRPTIIIGKGSPALAGLVRLACLPKPVVFGTGKTMVQPIFVGDLALAISEILSADGFSGETLELGGRESLSIEDFMKRIREFLKGHGIAALHWPLAPTIALLGVLEKFLSPILPLNAGQLYSFQCDGLVGPNDLSSRLSPQFLSVKQMLEESLCP
ncbi:MAG TPA: NAD-dependent epimerase/dehydratase family protein [Patescibacteria group bacterium]|nr:NAD-dependent epimerase/dehydratase family protein [Patescibacteria group bacterium]